MLNLKLGSKITILKNMDLVPACYYGTLVSYYYSSYAQHDNALFINIKLYRHKNIDRIVILPDEECFIFIGKFEDAWRKEKVNETETLLNRWSYSDLKDNKNLIYHHSYGESFKINDNYEYIDDTTSDYLCENNLHDKDAINDNGYLELLKNILKEYNIKSVKNYFKMYGENFSKCIDKALLC